MQFLGQKRFWPVVKGKNIFLYFFHFQTVWAQKIKIACFLVKTPIFRLFFDFFGIFSRFFIDFHKTVHESVKARS